MSLFKCKRLKNSKRGSVENRGATTSSLEELNMLSSDEKSSKTSELFLTASSSQESDEYLSQYYEADGLIVPNDSVNFGSFPRY